MLSRHRRRLNLNNLMRAVEAMKQRQKPVVLILAIVGVCAVVYGVWHLYQGESR